jgi:hypothetical protein
MIVTTYLAAIYFPYVLGLIQKPLANGKGATLWHLQQH